MTADFTLLDYLITNGRSFAVYRLPGKSPVMYIQDGKTPDILSAPSELNGRSGFVMAPFQAGQKHPLVVIRPDKVVQGETNILRLVRAELLRHDDLSYFNSNAEEDNAHPSMAESFGRTSSGEDFDRYKNAFELFQKALHAGSCEKIVLSRTKECEFPDGFQAGALFCAACNKYPDAFVYICSTPVTGTWIASTPELLLSGQNGVWQTVALAGTQKMNPSQTSWDKKNIREQEIVSAYIEKQLRIKNLMGSVSQPYTVQAGELVHLRTDFTFEMKDTESTGDLLDFLHPTPAVSGYPKSEACRLILLHEGYDRAYYTGFAGPLNRDGKTDLYVNLRCARVDDTNLVLYAGGGLMPDSELQSEWDETESKLQTLYSLINN